MTTIAVIPGDGTGPEVVAEAVKVLDAAAPRYGLELDYRHYDLGGSHYLRTGETLPDEVLAELRTVDAILFGAVGHPEVKPGVVEQSIILRLRKELDLYVNVRPIKLYPGVRGPLLDVAPEEVDCVVVRENTEGLYAGSGSFQEKGTASEVAVQESVNSRFAIERCVRYAFAVTAERPRGKLTLCGKSNVLTYAWDLWTRVFAGIAEEHPEVATDYANVDAAALWLVEDPGRFDVIVTDNMFGDILTDLGAAIQGGMGIAAGANLNPHGVSMFEPIGGTAPGFEGTGLINPLAAISAAAMLLHHVGAPDAGSAVEEAVARVAGSLPSLRAGEMGASTAEVGDRVAALVSPGVPSPAGERS